jgi:putative ABC transport system permease protein
MIPLDTMDELTGSEGKASVFYLKLDDVKNEKLVTQEIHATPGMSDYSVQTLEEVLSLMTPEKYPGFNIGLNVVIGIAVVIGFIVIFQAMYTAVLERTREIGILKSLGGSRLYIVNVVLRESMMLSLVGIALGIAASYLMRLVFHDRLPTLAFAISPGWVLKSIVVASLGSLLGALYPAWRAASKDPIDALAYE